MWAGEGLFVLGTLMRYSCIASATSSELISLQCTVLHLHTTELRPRAATPLLSLITVGKASYPIQARECHPGLPFLCRSGKQDVIFIFSLSTKADHWSTSTPL